MIFLKEQYFWERMHVLNDENSEIHIVQEYDHGGWKVSSYMIVHDHTMITCRLRTSALGDSYANTYVQVGSWTLLLYSSE